MIQSSSFVDPSCPGDGGGMSLAARPITISPHNNELLKFITWYPGAEFPMFQPIRTGRLIVWLGCIAGMTSLSIDLILPSLPMMESEFGLAPGKGGLSTSLFMTGYFLTPLLGGLLSDGIGRAKTLYASLLLYAAASILCAAAPGHALLFAGRLLQGCGVGIAVTMPLAIVSETFAGHDARAHMSLVNTVSGCMPIVLPLLGAFIAGARGWRAVFAAQSAAAIAMVLLGTVCFRTPPAEQQGKTLPQPPIKIQLQAIFKHHRFCLLAVIYGLMFACVFSFISASPLLLMKRMGMSRGVFSLVFALNSCGTICGSLCAAYLHGKMKQSRRLGGAGLVLILACSLLAFTLQAAGLHRPIAILPEVWLALFGFGLAAPEITMGALDTVPDQLGLGSGVLHCVLMLFGSVASGLMAELCSRHLQSAELVTTAAMVVAAAAAMGLYRQCIRRSPAEFSPART